MIVKTKMWATKHTSHYWLLQWTKLRNMLHLYFFYSHSFILKKSWVSYTDISNSKPKPQRFILDFSFPYWVKEALFCLSHALTHLILVRKSLWFGGEGWNCQPDVSLSSNTIVCISNDSRKHSLCSTCNFSVIFWLFQIFKKFMLKNIHCGSIDYGI